MTEPTTILISNASGAIPLEIVTKTNWTQYTLLLVVSGMVTLYFVWKLIKSTLGNPMTLFYLFKFSLLTKRKTILLRHQAGFLSFEMIDRGTINQFHKFLNKFRGKPFNLILNTPGGDVFATTLLSKILRAYPNKIHCYVPDYSMSGGSLLALSCDTIHFNRYSCIGTIDPQVGDLFNFGSASAWKEVLKRKKSKVNDKSIVYNRLGKQVEKTIYDYVYSTIKDKCNHPKEFADFLIKGNVEHIYQINGNDLLKYGFDLIPITKKEKFILDKLLRQKNLEKTVFGV